MSYLSGVVEVNTVPKPTIIFIIFWDFDVLTNFSFNTSETMRGYY